MESPDQEWLETPEGLDFAPIGIVNVEVRASDWRVFRTMTRDSFA